MFAALAFVLHLILIVLGSAPVLRPKDLAAESTPGTAPTWSALVFSLALATPSPTRGSRPWRISPRRRGSLGVLLLWSLFGGIGAVVFVSFAIAAIGISAYPPHADPAGPGATQAIWARRGSTRRSSASRRPSVPASGLGGRRIERVPGDHGRDHPRRDRLDLALRQRAPRLFDGAASHAAPGLVAELEDADRARLLVAGATIAIAILVGASLRDRRPLPRELTACACSRSRAAQLAVIRLRFTEPAFERPFRVPGNVRIRGVPVLLAALIGAPLTFVLWIGALATHDAARGSPARSGCSRAPSSTSPFAGRSTSACWSTWSCRT